MNFIPCHAWEAIVDNNVASEPEMTTDDAYANGADTTIRDEYGSTIDPKATSCLP